MSFRSVDELSLSLFASIIQIVLFSFLRVLGVISAIVSLCTFGLYKSE